MKQIKPAQPAGWGGAVLFVHLCCQQDQHKALITFSSKVIHSGTPKREKENSFSQNCILLFTVYCFAVLPWLLGGFLQYDWILESSFILS